MLENTNKWSNAMPLIVSFPGDWEDCLHLCKKIGIHQVFLVANLMANGDSPSIEDFRQDAAVLKDRMALFRNAGIGVAYWGGSLGHGMQEAYSHGFQEIVGSSLRPAPGQYCPLDIHFQTYLCKVYSLMAETGVDMLILDDDFRQHWHADPIGCFCPLHVQEFAQRTGRQWSAGELVQEVLSGKPTLWRKPWLEMMGDSLYQLAEKLEQAVHAVNPLARIGLCSVTTHWSSEGVRMPELLKRLAGATRPFLRTISAPYWSKEPHHAGWIAEYACLQKQWLSETDVEIVAEGDTFPHNRFYTSATMLHAYHQGLRAQSFPGMLNYILSYSLMPHHEWGYANKLIQQREHYEAITRFIPADYRTLGIRPYYTPYNFEHFVMPDSMPEAGSTYWPDEPYTLQYLSRLGIPMTYSEEAGPLLISGYNGVGLSNENLEKLLDQGALLDGVAASWIVERGIDIGITCLVKADAPVFEKYMDPEICSGNVGESVWLPVAPREKVFYHCKLQEEAKEITKFYKVGNEYAFPGMIHYESPSGRRIGILPFDFGGVRNMRQIMYNYVRQEQLAHSIAWVGRRPLPVSLHHHPDIHLICRLSPDTSRLVIVLQNLSLDPLVNPEFQLDSSISIEGGIEMLIDESKEPVRMNDYKYSSHGQFGQLKLELTLPSMGFLALALHS